jgi:hypothetical protein
VIVERLDNLKKDNDEAHARIEKQTTATNGKVASISRWQERTIGAVAILSTVILPIIIIIVSQFIIKTFKLN